MKYSCRYRISVDKNRFFLSGLGAIISVASQTAQLGGKIDNITSD